jgi:DNA-binding response OmpR family regulator
MSRSNRILVVSGDPAVFRASSALLRDQGFEVIEAATALAGLQLAREQPPELMVLDAQLADGSGLDAGRQIKADTNLQDVWVVLMSDSADAASQSVEDLAGMADDQFIRPVSPVELLAR